MSKKELEKQLYELVVIFRPEVLPKKAEDLVSQMVTQVDGSIEKVELMGKRKLSYEISKEINGLYIVFTLLLPKNASNELISKFNIENDILRNMFIR